MHEINVENDLNVTCYYCYFVTFYFLTLLFFLPGYVLNFIYISIFLHFYIFASQPLPLSLCLCLPHIYTCAFLCLCSVPLTMPMDRIRCIFIVLICHLMGQGGYFAPLTDFNAVEGGGFAGRRITLYLCSAIKDSGLTPPLHFSRNHLISRAFFRY